MPKISELPAASSVADADLVPIVQGGTTKYADGSMVLQDADRLDTAGQHTAGKATTEVALTIGSPATVTPNCADSNVFRLSLTQDCTLANPSNALSGQCINIILEQDATGGRTITLGNQYAFPGGTAPTFSTGANDKDLLSCQYDATDDVWLCSLSADFSVPA
jgi:hypothetical protein